MHHKKELNHIIIGIIMTFVVVSGGLLLSIVHNMQDEDTMASEMLKPSTKEYSIWIPNDLDETMVKSIYTSYDEEKLGVEFKITTFNTDIYYDTLINAGITNKLPDMFYVDNRQCLESLVEIGGVMDLSEYVATHQFDKNFKKEALEDFKVNGKIYGLPIMGDENVLYYNEDIFQSCNMTYPTTYEEFIETIVNFKQAHIIPLAVGGASPECAKRYYYMLLENYQDVESAVEAFENLVELEPFQSKYEVTEDRDALSAFIRGESAMFLGTSKQASLLERNKAEEKSFKVIPCPIGDKKVSFGNYTYGFVLSNKSTFNDEKIKTFYERFSRDLSWEVCIFRGKALPVYNNQITRKTRFTLLNACNEIMEEKDEEGIVNGFLDDISRKGLKDIYSDQIMSLIQRKIDSKVFLEALGL